MSACLGIIVHDGWSTCIPQVDTINKSPVARRGTHARGRAHSRAALTHARHAGGARRQQLRARRAGVHRGARGAHPVSDDDTQDRDRHGGRRKRHPEDGRHADAPAHRRLSASRQTHAAPRGVAWQHQTRTSHARYTAASAQRAASRPRAASPPPRTRWPRPFLKPTRLAEESWGRVRGLLVRDVRRREGR